MVKKNSQNENKLSFLPFISFFLLLFSLSLISFQISKKPKEVKAVAGQLNINAVSGGIQNLNQVGIGGDVTGSSAKLYVNGNVGIGTNSPAGMLHIAATSPFVINSAGQVGIGTTSPAASLQVVTPGGGNLYISDYGCGAYSGIGGSSTLTGCTNYALLTAGGDTFINRPSGSSIRFREANGEQVTIASGGNVGIGTTGPGAKLDVRGGDIRYNGTLVVTDSAGTPYTDNWIGRYNDGTNDWLHIGGITTGGVRRIGLWANTIYAAGNVGIGTTNPSGAIHVNSTSNTLAIVDAPAAYTSQFRLYKDGALKWAMYSPANSSDLRFYDTSDRITFQSGGNVGIGVTNPSYRLELPNNANASGQGRANAWITYSDIRFKENITPITNALDKINNIQGVYFDWKQNGKHDIGFIAQEVEKVLPEVVSTDSLGIKSLDYARLTALLTQGIKEQQTQIASQSVRFALLEKDLSLTSTSDLNIAKTQNGDYQVQNSQTGDIITRLSAFAEIIVGKIKAGLIETKKLIVDGVDILKKLNELSAKVDSQQKEIEALKEEIKKLKK